MTRESRVGVAEIFLACVRAVRDGRLIRRESRQDKEFHFQNWFRSRLEETGVKFDAGGRNSYPDFKLVEATAGFEVKGLAYPGRELSYDANSQVPSGLHNGRTIYYVFGRYPKDADEDEYPVIDLVICHGDLLNAAHDYVHKNKHVKSFGSYGDIMIRDRKMYVVPTPYALTDGITGQITLVLPASVKPCPNLDLVGELVRVEAKRLVVGYQFDLRTNALKPRHTRNPTGGKRHRFLAYRARGLGKGRVRMKPHMPNIDLTSIDDE